MAVVYTIEGSSGSEAYSYTFTLKRAFTSKLDAEIAVAQIEELLTEGRTRREELMKKARSAQTNARVNPQQRVVDYRMALADVAASDAQFVEKVNSVIPDAVDDISQEIFWEVVELELV